MRIVYTIFIQQAGCFHLAVYGGGQQPVRSGPLATPMTCSGRDRALVAIKHSLPLPLPLLTSLHSALNDDHYPSSLADDFWCFRWILDELPLSPFPSLSISPLREPYPLPDMTTMIIVKPSKAITAATPLLNGGVLSLAYPVAFEHKRVADNFVSRFTLLLFFPRHLPPLRTSLI